MVKNKSGITLLVLVITITVMLILTATTVSMSFDRFKLNNINKLIIDLELLDEKVSNYKLQYNGLPILREAGNLPIKYTYNSINFIVDDDDNENYYILDLSVMQDISLNYGYEGYERPNSSEDVYIINEQTEIIYYVKGIEYKIIDYHYLKQIKPENNIGPTKPEIKVVEGNLNYDNNNNEYYLGEVTLEFIEGKSAINNIEYTTYKILDITKENTPKTIVEETNIESLNNNLYTIFNRSAKIEVVLKTVDENGEESEIENVFNIYKEHKEPETTTSIYGYLEKNTDGADTYTLVLTQENIGEDKLVVSYNNEDDTINCWWNEEYSTKITKAEIRDCLRPAYSIRRLFANLENLTAIIDLDCLYTTDVEVMNLLFYECSSLTELDVSSFNTEKAQIMSGMFGFCSKLTSLDLSNFDTSNVTNMNEMFKSCSSLQHVELSSFDTSKVKNMKEMFRGCNSLAQIDISNFNTRNVTDISRNV